MYGGVGEVFEHCDFPLNGKAERRWETRTTCMLGLEDSPRIGGVQWTSANCISQAPPPADTDDEQGLHIWPQGSTGQYCAQKQARAFQKPRFLPARRRHSAIGHAGQRCSTLPRLHRERGRGQDQVVRAAFQIPPTGFRRESICCMASAIVLKRA